MPPASTEGFSVSLFKEMGCGVSGRSSVASQEKFSSGSQGLDQLLPQQGFPRGAFFEWLGELPASGAASLSLLTAREACRSGGHFIALDPHGWFHPPAAVAWGIDPTRLVILRPRNPRDTLWALDQTLRSPAVAVVWGWLDRLDPHTARRLALAAEESGAVGMLLRPPEAARQPSWAAAQLRVRPLRRDASSEPCWRVELARGRGADPTPRVVHLRADHRGQLHEIDPHETPTLPLVPALGRATSLPTTPTATR